MVRRPLGTRHVIDVECFVHSTVDTYTATTWEWFRVLLLMAREVVRLPKPQHRCTAEMITKIRKGRS